MNQKFSLTEYMEKNFGMDREEMIPAQWKRAGLYMTEIEEMLEIIHLFYTNREKYAKEIQRRANK